MIAMVEHNLSDLYGAKSIHYMKQKNTFNFFVWIIALILCCALIQRFITDQYDRIGTEQSIQNYKLLLNQGLGCMIILSFVWWLGTSSEWLLLARVRNFFEQYSQVCALIFDFLAFLSSLILSFSGKSGIDAKNGHFYPLHSLYILPSVFVCLMNFAPPVHIREVIFPQKRWGRWSVVVITMLSATLLFIIDFF